MALVGANGAGKTTTMRALAGRTSTYRGEVTFGGREMRTLQPGVRASIGLLPEVLPGFGWMTLREHLRFLSAFYPTFDLRYAGELADLLEVPLSTQLGVLSRGTKVKVAFVAAEAFRPAVLLLDEPTAGLDPVARRDVLRLVHERFPPGGERLVVFSTHILEDIEVLAERVVVLEEGHVRLDSSLAALGAGEGKAGLAERLYGDARHD